MLKCWRSQALRCSRLFHNVALNLADLEWILARPPPGLAELGRRVGASERTLSRMFRNEVGMTYTMWRNQLRLHLATLMLAGGQDRYSGCQRLRLFLPLLHDVPRGPRANPGIVVLVGATASAMS